MSCLVQGQQLDRSSRGHTVWQSQSCLTPPVAALHGNLRPACQKGLTSHLQHTAGSCTYSRRYRSSYSLTFHRSVLRWRRICIHSNASRQLKRANARPYATRVVGKGGWLFRYLWQPAAIGAPSGPTPHPQ